MSLNHNLKLFNWFNFLINLNFFTSISILYFSHVVGSYTQAAIVLATIPIATAVFEIPTGVYSDLIGRKKTIVLGTAAALISLLFYALGTHLIILIVGAIFHGAARAAYNGNNDAYLHNLLGEQGLESDYHHHRGRLETSFMLGSSIGALLSGFVANYSYALSVWLSFIPMLGAFFITLQFKSIPNLKSSQKNILIHLKGAGRLLRNNQNLKLLSLYNIFGDMFGRTAYDFQAAVYNAFWPLWAVGLARALTEWIAIPGAYFSGKIIDHLGSFKVIFLSHSYSWLTNFIAVLIPTKFSPLIISTSAVLWGPGEVAQTSLLQKEFTEEQRATIASLNSFIASILFAIFAYLMGIFADHYGPIKTLLLIQILIIPTFWINWQLHKNNKV